ncbi:hypothetical protein D3C78_1958560 [compost metagenome]
MAHLILQLCFALGKQCGIVGTLQCAAQGDQLAVEQLLVEFNEMRFAGAAEQHAGKQ